MLLTSLRQHSLVFVSYRFTHPFPLYIMIFCCFDFSLFFLLARASDVFFSSLSESYTQLSVACPSSRFVLVFIIHSVISYTSLPSTSPLMIRLVNIPYRLIIHIVPVVTHFL